MRRLLGKIFRIVPGISPAASEKHARRFDRRRGDEAAAKNEDYEGYDKEDQNKRMDADNRWWVAELLAADCEKAWLHDGWEDTMQKWC